MDFIFMLTKDDRTVPNALSIAEEVAAAGVRHMGCKEVGASPDLLRGLVDQIRRFGGKSYLELVGATPESSLAAAARAKELGFDCLFGGMNPRAIHALCGDALEYFPFAGRIEGHPVRLRGTADELARDCRRLAAEGHPGVDLLVYRAVDDDPEAILRKCRDATAGRLFVAGSVDSPERIRQLKKFGVDAFTIGSAILTGSIFPDAATLRERVARVLECCESAPGR